MSDHLRPYYSDEDYYHYNAPQKLNKWQFFIAYILPWLFLLGISFGLFLSMNYILQVIFILSEPLADAMKGAGL